MIKTRKMLGVPWTPIGHAYHSDSIHLSCLKGADGGISYAAYIPNTRAGAALSTKDANCFAVLEELVKTGTQELRAIEESKKARNQVMSKLREVFGGSVQLFGGEEEDTINLKSALEVVIELQGNEMGEAQKFHDCGYPKKGMKAFGRNWSICYQTYAYENLELVHHFGHLNDPKDRTWAGDIRGINFRPPGLSTAKTPKAALTELKKLLDIVLTGKNPIPVPIPPPLIVALKNGQKATNKLLLKEKP